MRTCRCLFAVLLATVFTVAAYHPTLSARQDRPSPNLPALKAAAEQGDAKAQLAYADALGSAEGRAWAQKAANQGLAEAWYWLGQRTPGPENLPFYEKAAELGFADAFWALLERLLCVGKDLDI